MGEGQGEGGDDKNYFLLHEIANAQKLLNPHFFTARVRR